MAGRRRSTVEGRHRAFARGALAALLLAGAPAAAPAAAEGEGAPAPAAAPREGDGPVAFAFGWDPPQEARVTVRRTRVRTGARTTVFTARHEARLARDEEGLALSASGAAWEGDLPFAPGLADPARRATEAVVQRITPEGRFDGLEGTGPLREVLARVLEEARVPPEDAERALDVAEAGLRREAEEVWNLAVGFWIGARLELGRRYELTAEAALPLVGGPPVPHRVEFSVRRRVPCAAGARALACVEAVLRAAPEPAALQRRAAALRAALGAREPHGPPLPPDLEGAEGPPPELSAEGELVLVTEPGRLLPHRLVWTRAVRLAAPDAPPLAEAVDRVEYGWRHGPFPAPPAMKRPKRARPPRAAPPAASPASPPAAVRPAG